MRLPVMKIWERVWSSLWFLPAVMVFVASGGAFVALALDRRSGRGMADWPLLYGGGAEGAREVLGTIATSMITVAGVVFSITIVALTLASQQFGPRVLRNFMADRGNQVVLGTFISTFVYCLLVVRSIRGGDGSEFVPHLSVTLAVLLAVISLGVLIYFIHHVSTSIQAEMVVARIAEELEAATNRLYPEHLGVEEERAEPVIDARYEMRTEIRSEREGYLQVIDNRRVMTAASGHDLILQFAIEPGDFVAKGDLLAEVFSRAATAEEARKAIAAAFVIGSTRTPEQDVEFPLQQLVQVAVRALSPSLNDPFTANAAIDRIVAGLGRLGRRRFPSPVRNDEREVMRIIAPRKDFGALAESTLRTLVESAERSPVVIEHLRASLQQVAAELNAERGAALVEASSAQQAHVE